MYGKHLTTKKTQIVEFCCYQKVLQKLRPRPMILTFQGESIDVLYDLNPTSRIRDRTEQTMFRLSKSSEI